MRDVRIRFKTAIIMFLSLFTTTLVSMSLFGVFIANSYNPYMFMSYLLNNYFTMDGQIFTLTMVFCFCALNSAIIFLIRE